MRASLRAAVRAFVHRPSLAFGVVALVALAVGLAGGFWATVDATLLRPLPYPAPARLVAVMEHHEARGEMAVTPATFRDWSDAAGPFERVGGAYALDLGFAGDGDVPVRVPGARVTEGYFEAWRVPALVGRALRPEDFVTGQAAVIGYGVWQMHYGGRPDVVGATARIDGRSYTVVGVMPPTFRVPGRDQVWVPWMMSAEESRERRLHLVGVIARLEDGRSVASAAQELETFYAALRRTHVDLDGWRPVVRPLRAHLLGDVSRALTLMAAAVACLVAVAWANLIGLLAASWPARRTEVMLRLALGASTGQVVRQLAGEVAVWAGAGAMIGLAVAHVVLGVFSSWLLVGDGFDFQPRIDLRLIGATAGFLAVTLLAVALGPLLWFVARDTAVTPTRHAQARGGFRFLVLSGQMAGAVVLLALAASLVTGLSRLERLASVGDSNLVAMDVTLSELDAADEPHQRAFFETLLERLREHAEIAAVAAASYVPPTPPLGTYRFDVVGQPADGGPRAAVTSAVDPGAFAMLGVSLVRGRFLAATDGEGAPLVGAVSESFVRRYLDGDEPIGRQLQLAGIAEPLTIVGVVSDVRQPLAPDARIEALLYVSYRQVPWPFMTLLVEPRGDAMAAVRAVRDEVRRLAPDQAAGDVRRLHDLRSAWLGPARSRTGLAALFAMSAAILTLAGLYAAVAREVATRRRELAIRQALGASAGRVIVSLTLRASATAGAGALAGGALLFTLIAPLLGRSADAPPLDGLTVGLVAAAILTAAVVSAYLPARRAVQADPSPALRAE